jgi:hypothetical protein
MAEAKQTETPVKELVYVTIPETDIYDAPHPGVHIICGGPKLFSKELGRYISDPEKSGRDMHFEAGHTYATTPEIAEEVNKRLTLFEKETIRLLRPKADRKALEEVNKGSNWSVGSVRPTQGTQAFSLEGGLGQVGSANERVITIE